MQEAEPITRHLPHYFSVREIMPKGRLTKCTSFEIVVGTFETWTEEFKTKNYTLTQQPISSTTATRTNLVWMLSKLAIDTRKCKEN